MKYKSLRSSAWVALGAVVAVGIAAPARADVLEQKWQAGQQLAYDLKTDGTIRITAPEGIPFIAGMPLEFLFKGDGATSMVTSAVDEFGTATVVPRLDRLQLKMNETAFNQNAVLGLRNGRMTVTMNGQQAMPPMDVSKFIDAPYGLRVTKQLRVVGVAPLNPEAEAEAAPDAGGDKKADDAKAPLKLPANALLMIQAVVARSLPALLPAKDVALGDEWTANIEMPPIPGTPAATAQKTVGAFTLKAIAAEELQGRKTWRIAVDGNVKVEEQDSKGIADEVGKMNEATKENITKEVEKAAQKAGGLNLPFKVDPKIFTLFSMNQTIKGNLWFDAAAGQIVSGDIRLDATATTRPDAKVKPASLFDYGANVKLDLRKVAYENAQ